MEEARSLSWADIHYGKSIPFSLIKPISPLIVDIEGRQDLVKRCHERRDPKDVVADAVAATAATTEAKNWLQKVDGQRMASFSILKFGDHAATLMAGEWCRRRQFFFNLWMQQGAPDEISFSAEEVGSYEASEEWAQWFGALTPTDAAFQRASALNSYAPGH